MSLLVLYASPRLTADQTRRAADALHRAAAAQGLALAADADRCMQTETAFYVQVGSLAGQVKWSAGAPGACPGPRRWAAAARLRRLKPARFVTREFPSASCAAAPRKTLWQQQPAATHAAATVLRGPPPWHHYLRARTACASPIQSCSPHPQPPTRLPSLADKRSAGRH